jgi:hypothetical protein
MQHEEQKFFYSSNSMSNDININSFMRLQKLMKSLLTLWTKNDQGQEHKLVEKTNKTKEVLYKYFCVEKTKK